MRTRVNGAIRVNGVPLDNTDLGWILRPGSKPYSGLEMGTTQLTRAGRDGNVPTPSTLASPLWPLKVNTYPDGWEALQALFLSPDLVITDDFRPGLEVRAKLASSTPDRVFDRNEMVEATFVVELFGAFWRDKLASTFPAALSSAAVSLDVFPDMSAPVQDAVIRVKGSASGLQITDASSAWATLPNVTGAQWVRFESDTGRCFVTTTDTWSGGAEVSGQVDFGGPRGVFEITPVLAPGDPSSRKGVLTVATVSRSGAIIEVRGKGAYVL